MYVVGALERAPYSEALLRVEGGNHSVIFYIELFLRPSIFTFDDIVTFSIGTNAFFDQIAFEGVVCTPYDLGEPLALFYAEDGRKGMVFDRYRLNSFREKIAVRMSQQEKGLLRMIDRPIRQTRLIVFDEGDAIFPGNILG